jgi:hypothetical protein
MLLLEFNEVEEKEMSEVNGAGGAEIQEQLLADCCVDKMCSSSCTSYHGLDSPCSSGTAAPSHGGSRVPLEIGVPLEREFKIFTSPDVSISEFVGDPYDNIF